MANILDILTRAQALRQETALNSITPDRAGGIMYDTLILINQMQLEGGSLLISKVYSSVAAMEADTTPTSDLTGRALRPGQLAVIVPSSSTSSDMGSVYRYNEPGSWTLCGKIGGLPMDTVPTEGSSNGITSGAVYQLQQEVTTDISQLRQKVMVNLGGEYAPFLKATNKYIDGTVWALNLGNDYTADLVPVIPGQSLEIAAQPSQNANYTFITEQEIVNGRQVVFAEGYTGKRNLGGGQTSGIITAPSDAAYLWILIRYTGVDHTPSSIKLYNHFAFLIDTLTDRVDRIEGDLYNQRTIEISWVNNLMAEASNFRTRNGKRCSLPILLRSGESVNITTVGDGGYVMYPIVQVSGPTATVANSYTCAGLVAQIDSSSHSYRYTAAADTYICLSGDNNCVVSFELKSDSKIEFIEDELKITAQRLKGKNVVFFGDSLTSNSTQGVLGFAKIIADAAGLPYRGFVYDSDDGNTADAVVNYPTVTNYAKDGTCIRTKTGRSDGVLDRVKRHILPDSDVDYILVEMPANDAANENLNLGEMSESYTATYDTDTQLGALEELCRYISELGKPIKFGCFIPWRIAWIRGNDFFDSFIPVFEKWGIPYLDLRNKAGFDLRDCAAHRNLYSLTADSYSAWNEVTTYNLDDKVKYGGSLYKSLVDGNVGHLPTDTAYWLMVSSDSVDGTHLNTIGNKIVVGKILSFLESL